MKTVWNIEQVWLPEVTEMATVLEFKEFSKLVFDIIKGYAWDSKPAGDILRNRILYQGTMKSIQGNINIIYYLTDTRYFDIQFIYMTKK